MRTLAGLLRVAIGLDRGHAGHVADVQVRRTDAGLVVEAVAAEGADIELELYAADERVQLLAEVLGCAVEIRASAVAW